MNAPSPLPSSLPFRLERTVLIRATPDTVFRFFTDSPRFASWWGRGSTIDPVRGGRVSIRHPNDIESGGEILEIDPPRRIVFTYGFVSGKPIPAGSSRVSVELSPTRSGTRLHLVHELADEAARDEHVQGWRFQLSLFANAVSDDLNADAAAKVDAWFDAWAEPDAAVRRRRFESLAAEDVRFRDRFSALDGLEDLLPHVAAAQRFMPGVRLRRSGDARHCQGTVVADWVASGTDGRPIGSGSNVFILGPTGKIEAVTGLWAPAPSS